MAEAGSAEDDLEWPVLGHLYKSPAVFGAVRLSIPFLRNRGMGCQL